MAQYIVGFNYPDYTNAQIERDAASFTLPFRSLPVYYKAKLWLGSRAHHHLMANEWDVVHACQARTDTRGRSVTGRFDTVLVNTGTGQYTGIEGKYYIYLK